MRYLFLLLYSILFNITMSYGQKHDFRIALAYTIYEKDFYLNSFAQSNGYVPSPHGRIRYSTALFYSYYFNKRNSWFLDVGLNYAYRSSIVGKLSNSGFAREFSQRANYIDFVTGAGYQFSLNRKLSIAPRLNIGYGLPLQSEKEQTTVPLRNPDFNFTGKLFYATTGVSFKLIFAEKSHHQWWIGVEPRLLVFFTNMYDLNKLPVAKNEAPHFSGGLELQLGFSFW